MGVARIPLLALGDKTRRDSAQRHERARRRERCDVREGRAGDRALGKGRLARRAYHVARNARELG
jgi:hypothetical protein